MGRALLAAFGIALLSMPPAATAQADLDRQLALQRSEIARLRGAGGGYDSNLIEANMGLGALLSRAGDHEAAAEAYNEAFQLSRINYGLHSEGQLPAIEALIRSRSELGQWQEVDGLHELSLDLAEQVYGAADRRYLSLAKRHGRWRLRTVAENLLEQSSRARLAAAAELSRYYDEVLARAGGDSPSLLPLLLPILIDKSEADLTSATAVARTSFLNFNSGASPFVTETRCEHIRDPASGQVRRQCYNLQVENPRYRQSQYDAKQFELARRLDTVARTVEGLQGYLDGGGLDAVQAVEVAGQIRRLEEESQDIRNLARRERLF